MRSTRLLCKHQHTSQASANLCAHTCSDLDRQVQLRRAVDEVHQAAMHTALQRGLRGHALEQGMQAAGDVTRDGAVQHLQVQGGMGERRSRSGAEHMRPLREACRPGADGCRWMNWPTPGRN